MKISTEISRFSMQACSALMARFLLPTGKKNKLRVYYLSWLRNRILHNDPEVEKKQGWITVGDLEGCIHYKVGEWLGPPCWASISGKMAGGIFCVTTAGKIASGWLSH